MTSDLSLSLTLSFYRNTAIVLQSVLKLCGCRTQDLKILFDFDHFLFQLVERVLKQTEFKH